MSFQGLSPVLNESVSAVTLTNSIDVGTVRVQNGEEYVYVYNAGNSQISVNLGAVLSATTGYSVTVSSVTGADVFMGVCKHATITTGAYGWLLSKGFVNVSNGMASTALAAGAMIVPAANGAVQEHTGALTAPVHGKVVQSTGSAGVAYAFVRCFGV